MMNRRRFYVPEHLNANKFQLDSLEAITFHGGTKYH